VIEEVKVRSSQGTVQLEEEKGKRKILNFLRKRRKAKDEPAPAPAKSTTPGKEPKTVKIVTSTIHRYKKVDGIDSKVTQLVVAHDKLLAVGLDGVFEIDGTKSTPVLEEPVRSVFLSKSIDQLLIGTFGEQIKSYSLENNLWRETHLLDTLNDFISYMFEDKLENIWLCSRTKIYKVETDEHEIINILTLPIDNTSLDETVGLAYGSEVYVAASGEFKRYNGDDRFLRYDSLPGPHKYFASAGYFWFNDGHKWRTIDRKIQSLKLEWLGLFPSLRFLAPDEAGDGLWLITGDNQLFKFYNTKAIAEGLRYPLFLREIRGQEVNLGQELVKMAQPENVVSFEFIQPNYIGLHATEYRYQVKGLTNSWSTWSNVNNVIPFPFLSPGVYQLAAQSRDMLGNESRIELINFEVMPPYWKQWWFYALEFLFFSLLVAITVKLSANNERYRVISQVLSLLTVIMLIQFIQTGIDSVLEFKSSPVVEFFIQVSIALIVFPVEGFVRKMIIGASSGKYRIPLKRKKEQEPPAPESDI
jgi:Y_Y_Y domain.